MYLFFDTETTGKPKSFNASFKDLDNWPRITQLAWQVYNSDGELFKSFSSLIIPDKWEIPKEKFFIDNNMSTERCKKEGIKIELALNNFLQEIENCKYILAHNLNFDLNVCASEMFRLGLFSINKPIKVCTMLATTDIVQIPSAFNNSFKWPSLTELHNFLFNCDFEGAHDALDDVNAMAKCFFELKKKGLISYE